VTESWCLRLKDGSIYNADINDIGEVERRGIDVAAAGLRNRRQLPDAGVGMIRCVKVLAYRAWCPRGFCDLDLTAG
jgi:hypothetical protein